MKLIAYYFIIFFIFNNVSCTPIVKGTRIKSKYFKDYNFMVSLQTLTTKKEGNNEFIHLCGGVFINENWILTAAHCVYDRNSSDLYVQVGSTIMEHNQAKYLVEKIKIFQFNRFTMRNDIALVKITQRYEEYIKNLKLPYDIDLNKLLKNKSSCKILGFGANIYGGQNQHTLHEANIILITNKECISLLGRIMGPKPGDNTVCAVGFNGEDACQGDSGGPLICSHNDNDYIFGIVSHGLSCGAKGIPSVYTLIKKYISLIEQITLSN